MFSQIILAIILTGIAITIVWAVIGGYRYYMKNRPARRIKEFFKEMINNDYEESERPYLNEEINN